MDPSPRLSPGDHLGPYEIVAPLGAGGMGEVYRARDPRLEREVALKVLPTEMGGDPERLARFEREAKALAALNHPHIVTVYSVEEAEGVRYLTMELVEGETLDEIVPAGGLDLERFLEIAIPLADAVAAAHARGIVHRDLKPANLMLTSEGRVKVLDFGLARRAEPPEGESLAYLPTETLEKVTREGQVVGTVPYMSPEQIQGRPATACSDIFSLGAILHEMATGERLFDAETSPDLISSILRDDPPPLTGIRPDLPRQLGRIVARCLAKDPERRFQTALDVRNELEELREEVASETAVETDAPTRDAGRPVWQVGLAAAVGVLLIAAIVWAVLSTGGFEDVGTDEGSWAFGSVVVLPATVQGPEGDAYLADAIPGTLSTKLTGVEGLETKAPPRSAELEGKEMSHARLAELYGVDALVMPSVTAEADRFLLIVQLVEATNRRLVWSQQYRGNRNGYLDLVERAAVELQRQLRPDERVRESEPGITKSSAAELAFREGQYFSNQYNRLRRAEDFDAALRAFENALEFDPKMAEAAAEIGFLHYLHLEEGDAEAVDAVEHWAERAIEFDSGTSLAWTDLAYAAVFRGEFMPSLRYALEAAAGQGAAARSNNAFAFTLWEAGLPELCVHVAQESVRANPLYLAARTVLGGCTGALGRADRSLEIAEETLAIEPNELFARLMKIFILLELDRVREARAALDEPAISALDEHIRELLRVRLALKAGTASSRATAQKLIRIVRESPYGAIIWIPGWLGELARREPGESLIVLLQEIDRRMARPLAYPVLTRLSEHSFLREEPEFQSMLARSRAQLDEVLEILAAAEQEGKLPAYLEDPLAEVLRRYETL